MITSLTYALVDLIFITGLIFTSLSSIALAIWICNLLIARILRGLKVWLVVGEYIIHRREIKIWIKSRKNEP